MTCLHCHYAEAQAGVKYCAACEDRKINLAIARLRKKLREEFSEIDHHTVIERLVNLTEVPYLNN